MTAATVEITIPKRARTFRSSSSMKIKVHTFKISSFSPRAAARPQPVLLKHPKPPDLRVLDGLYHGVVKSL